MMHLIAITAAVVGLAVPAHAALGGTQAEFERFLKRFPKGNFKRIPDAEHPGTLYAGRLGGFSTIVRLHTDKQGRIVREKIEVALPLDSKDDYALAILSRFIGEFIGKPEHLLGLMDASKSLKHAIMTTGKRHQTMTYHGAEITLSLDSSPDEFHPTKGAWGLLFWKADAARASN